MNLKKIAPTVLTVCGSVGVVATAVLSGKATVRAHERLKVARDEKGSDLTTMEVVKVAGKEYIWTAVAAGATIGCVIGSNAISNNTIAGLTGALYYGGKKFADYRKQVIADYGVAEDQRIMEKVDEVEKFEEETLEKLCEPTNRGTEVVKRYYDSYHNSFFWTTSNQILFAQYEVNRIFQEEGEASITDFQDALGLEHLSSLEDTGWSYNCLVSCKGCSWITITTQEQVDENGETYEAILYITSPCDIYKEDCYSH